MTEQQQRELEVYQKALAETRAEAKRLCYEYQRMPTVGRFQAWQAEYKRFVNIHAEYFQWEVNQGL